MCVKKDKVIFNLHSFYAIIQNKLVKLKCTNDMNYYTLLLYVKFI